MTNKVIAEINITKQITEDDIESIIIGAFEGGSNYWLESIDDSTEEWAVRPKGEPFSTWTVRLLLEGKTVHLYDKEDQCLALTLDKVLFGIQMNQMKRPFDSDLENGDQVTMDCIIQYSLFNELVYG